MSVLCDTYLEILEANNWYVSSYTDDDRVELEISTPAGEEYYICVSTINFLMDIDQTYSDFDTDEYVYMWLDAKQYGVAGVPGAKELVENAAWIEQELRDLRDELFATLRK